MSKSRMARKGRGNTGSKQPNSEKKPKGFGCLSQYSLSIATNRDPGISSGSKVIVSWIHKNINK